MIQQLITVQVPDSRRVVIELPPEVPVGMARLDIRVLGDEDAVVEVPPPEINAEALPKYFDEQSGEWKRVGRSGVVREVRPGQ